MNAQLLTEAEWSAIRDAVRYMQSNPSVNKVIGQGWIVDRSLARDTSIYIVVDQQNDET